MARTTFKLGADQDGTHVRQDFGYIGTSHDLSRIRRMNDTTKVELGTGENYGRSPGMRLTSARLPNGDTRVVWANTHGDLSLHVDPSQNCTVTRAVTFEPYGEQHLEWSNATTEQETDLGFQSDYTDPTTGLVDMGARWYNPANAGFTSRDVYNGRLETPMTLNRYTYAANNPITYWDPTGYDYNVYCGCYEFYGGGSDGNTTERYYDDGSVTYTSGSYSNGTGSITTTSVSSTGRSSTRTRSYDPVSDWQSNINAVHKLLEQDNNWTPTTAGTNTTTGGSLDPSHNTTHNNPQQDTVPQTQEPATSVAPTPAPVPNPGPVVQDVQSSASERPSDAVFMAGSIVSNAIGGSSEWFYLRADELAELSAQQRGALQITLQGIDPIPPGSLSPSTHIDWAKGTAAQCKQAVCDSFVLVRTNTGKWIWRSAGSTVRGVAGVVGAALSISNVYHTWQAEGAEAAVIKAGGELGMMALASVGAKGGCAAGTAFTAGPWGCPVGGAIGAAIVGAAGSPVGEWVTEQYIDSFEQKAEAGDACGDGALSGLCLSSVYGMGW